VSPTVTLRAPIERKTRDGKVVETIAELTIRKPKLGDLTDALDAAGGIDKQGTLILHLAARCTGITPGELAALELEDGSAVLEAVTGFMPAGLLTGTAGSR
jgi:hypothetical protein